MLLPPISWAHRVWALPLMTVLCPSEHVYEQQDRRAQTLVQRAWQIIHVVIRQRPGRVVVVFVADRRDAAQEWLHQVRTLGGANLITRLRLDAALDDPPTSREAGPLVRPRLKGAWRSILEATVANAEMPWNQLTIAPWQGDGPREVEVATDTVMWSHAGKPPGPMHWVLIRDPHKSFASQALLSTNLHHTPEQIQTWLIRRWTMEVTREEARAHLGLETQRQWQRELCPGPPRRC